MERRHLIDPEDTSRRSMSATEAERKTFGQSLEYEAQHFRGVRYTFR